ncbi:MAG TPA: VOC family protein, partial [Alphaproteobacteria bacterium]
MLRSLQHAALTVPDLEVGRNFYARMGLEAAQLGDGLVFRCPGRAQDQVRLVEGKKKRLAYVSFGTTARELPGLKRKLEAAGTKLVDAPFKVGGEGIWFRDPDGDLVNVMAAPDRPQRRPPVAINNAGDFKRLGKRGAPDRNIEAKPRRLGHVLKFSLDLQRAIDFYTGTLGMKLSDRIGGMAAFLRFAGDSDHHTLALAQSQGTGLHHMSFEMG